MEITDRELIQKLSPANASLARLYREHEDLENKLLKLERRGFLTREEEGEMKKLKAQKLAGVDSMMRILAEYRIIDNSLAM